MDIYEFYYNLQKWISKLLEHLILFQRLDGRRLLEPRPVKIYFGSKWGCCMVSLGHTK